MDGSILTTSKYAADHQNHITNQNPTGTSSHASSIPDMQLSTDPGDVGSESLPGSLAQELERIRFVLKEIKSNVNGSAVAQWYSKGWTAGVANGSITTAKLATSATLGNRLDLTGSPTLVGSDTQLISGVISVTRAKLYVRGWVYGYGISVNPGGSCQYQFTLKQTAGGTTTIGPFNTVVCDGGANTITFPIAWYDEFVFQVNTPQNVTYELRAGKAGGNVTSFLVGRLSATEIV